MPGTSKAKNPSGLIVEFDEVTHIYKSIIHGHEVQYTSGTTFLGQFYPKFDPTGDITARCAKKEGISVAELQKRWKDKAANSCRIGTRTHEVCEDIELGRELRNKPEDDTEKARFDNAILMANKVKSRLDIIGVEKIVFSNKLSTPIAGTIDLLGKSKENGTYIILDWKTNKKIEKFNTYEKYCLDPISHIPAINYHEYALQLNLYQFLLKYEGYVPRKAQFRRFLCHITETNHELIELPDYQDEIKMMLIYSAYWTEHKHWLKDHPPKDNVIYIEDALCPSCGL